MTENNNSYKINGHVTLEKNTTNKTTKKGFADKRKNIKVDTEAKTEIDIIKVVEKVKYDYEAIQLLIDSYKNSLPPIKRKQFDSLLEAISDKY